MSPANAFPGAPDRGRVNPASQGGGTPVQISQSDSPEAASGALIPFSRVSRTRIDSGRQLTGTMAAATNQLTFSPLPTTGYLAIGYLQIALTTAANAAAVAFNADAPWNFIRQLQFRTPDGTPILNALTGYQLYQIAKLGSYRLGRPEGSALDFTTVTGAVGNGGSFTMTIPLHFEFGRDTLGPLPNMNATAAYQLDLTIGTTADLYSVAPTAAGSYTITLYLESYSNPPADFLGQPARTTPPALGSTQFWTVQNYSWSGTGEQNVILNRTGNLIRDLILIWRTAAGARSATVFPTGNLRIELDQQTLQNENTRLNQFRYYRWLNFDLDTGVYLINYTSDPDNVMTGEFGDKWLPTFTETRYALIFTPAVAGSLEILLNDITPAGDIYRI